MVASLTFAVMATTQRAAAQCQISIEQFGDPRLENPTFFTSADPDGAGPLPEQFLVSAGLNFSSSQLQIITENTTVALPWTIPVGSAVMYQGQWHVHTTFAISGFQPLQRWNGTAFEAIPQVAGVIRGITVHEGEIYIVTSIVNGTFTGQVIRWNGERAQVVGRTTLRSTAPTRVEFASVGSTLYIAGGFALVENVPVNGVAAFLPSTSTGTWTSPQFPTGVGTPTVRALAMLDNRVYALADGSTGSNFFGLNPTGSAWEFARDATTPTRGPNSNNDATLVATGGFIYAFTGAGSDGYSRGNSNVPLGYGFYRWNGTHWLDMTGLAPEWRNMRSYRPSASGSRVLATRYRGQFAFVASLASVSSSPSRSITAIMLWDGTKFTLFNKGISGEITDMVEYEGGQVVVGFFDFAGGQLVEGVAWWDGQTFHPMGPTPRMNWSAGLGGVGFYQAHVMNGELYLAGEFFFGTGGTDFRSNVVRWSGADWLSAYSGSSFPISQVYGLSSTGTTLIAGGTNGYVEVTGGVARSFQQLRGYAFEQRENAFYFASASSSTGRVGIREGPGTYRWLTPSQQSPPDRLLAFRDELLAFGGSVRTSDGASFTSIERLLPDGRFVPAGRWYNVRGSSISNHPAEFQGDVWWGKLLTNGGNPPYKPFVRWNGIETVAPSLIVNGVDVTNHYQLGRNAARVQNTDGTEELWLNLRTIDFPGDVFPNSIILRYRASAPPAITLQPVTPTLLPSEAATFSFATQSSEGVTFAWRFNHIALNDGYVPGLGLVSGSRTTNLTINNLERFNGTIDAVATTNCGTSYTNAVPLAIIRCDSIDFNNDNLFPTDEDLIDFLSILAGGACSPGNTCNDIDFNNDGLFPADDDLLAFLRVLAGGTC